MSEWSVLLVEDNDGDVILTTEALAQAGIKQVQVASDGQHALDMLDAANILPDLILLDINLPKVNGLEVLSVIKNSERFRTIPVIMLTTSSSERDIALAYQQHANCYIVKSVDLDAFIEAIKKMTDFWFHVVRLRTLPS